MPKLSPKTEADGEWLLPDMLHSMGGTKSKTVCPKVAIQKDNVLGEMDP